MFIFYIFEAFLFKKNTEQKKDNLKQSYMIFASRSRPELKAHLDSVGSSILDPDIVFLRPGASPTKRSISPKKPMPAKKGKAQKKGAAVKKPAKDDAKESDTSDILAQGNDSFKLINCNTRLTRGQRDKMAKTIGLKAAIVSVVPCDSPEKKDLPGW